MEIKIKNYLINTLDNGNKIYLCPMDEETYTRLMNDFSRLSDQSSINRFVDKYGFKHTQIILDGDTYISANDKETLEAMKMTAREFSARTGIYERTLSAIINGNEDITFDIAYKLSLYFDNSVNYWTNLQNQYNLYTYEIESEKEL